MAEQFKRGECKTCGRVHCKATPADFNAGRCNYFPADWLLLLEELTKDGVPQLVETIKRQTLEIEKLRAGSGVKKQVTRLKLINTLWNLGSAYENEFIDAMRKLKDDIDSGEIEKQ